MQMLDCPRQDRFDRNTVRCAFNAHVRSVLEYASVIWSGTAVTHLARLERLQHRFLMWLGARTRSQCPPMDYGSLLLHFNTMSIKARFMQADMMFMYKVLHQRIDRDLLVSLFGLNVPGRRSRHTGVFHEPFGRVNTVKNSILARLPRNCNLFLQHSPASDFFHSFAPFRREALEYARTVGTYAG